MKIQWKSEDIKPGRLVRKPGCNETWILGYRTRPPSEGGRQYAKISLADGMIAALTASPQVMADNLNAAGEQPVELVVEKDK